MVKTTDPIKQLLKFETTLYQKLGGSPDAGKTRNLKIAEDFFIEDCDSQKESVVTDLPPTTKGPTENDLTLNFQKPKQERKAKRFIEVKANFIENDSWWCLRPSGTRTLGTYLSGIRID